MRLIIQLAVGKTLVKVTYRILLVLVSVLRVCSYGSRHLGIWLSGRGTVAEPGEGGLSTLRSQSIRHTPLPKPRRWSSRLGRGRPERLPLPGSKGQVELP